MGDLYLYVICPRGPESAELAMKLRGGPVFDQIGRGEYGIRPRRSSVAEDGSTTTSIPTTRRPDQVAFADLTHVVDLPDLWFDLSRNAKTIVDVHFPLGALAYVQAIQPGRNDKTRDEAEDAAAAAHWAAPQRLARALDVLAMADVIVSPHRSWARLLEHWLAERGVRRKVHVLGDVNSARSGGEFWVTLLAHIDQITATSLLQRLVRRVLVAGVRRGVRDDMARDLANVDFSYAEVPS